MEREQPPYRSLELRTKLLSGLVIAQLVLLVIALFSYLSGASLIQKDLLAAAEIVQRGVTALNWQWPIWLVAAIVFLTWVHGMTSNLSALGSVDCFLTPSEAVWSFIIPIVSLWRGHRVMATIWRESQPRPLNEAGFAQQTSTTIVSWWWAIYLVTAVFNWVSSRRRGEVIDPSTALRIGAMSLALEVASGAMFLFMINRAQRRQDEQWRDLELRRKVPMPTGEALR
jgi:hypothetical protein